MKIHRLGAVVVIGLLAACGSGDDAEPATADTDGTAEQAAEPAAEPAEEPSAEPAEEPTAEPAEEPAAEPAPAASDDAAEAGGAGADDESDAANDGGDSMSIDSLDDIPQECRDILADFLREIEPMVQDVDWENATLADLEAFGTSIEAPAAEIDVEMEQAGCNDLDFDGDDEAGFELSLELARREAPGVVGWLEFIRDAATAFDTTAGDATGDATDDTAETPENCDEALQAVRELMDETATMRELPVDELLAAGAAIQNLTTVCSVDEMADLFEDPDFQAWSEG